MRARALLATGAVFALACGWLACSSFGASDGSSLSPDAALELSASDASSAGDARPASDASDAALAPTFCALQDAASLFCDDFEGNGGELKSSWERSSVGGSLAIIDAPGRPGHVLKAEATKASSEVSAIYNFDVDLSVSRFYLDVDVRVQDGGYDYATLVLTILNGGYANDAGITRGYGLGMQSGAELGRVWSPPDGPLVPVDASWHHLHLELTHSHQLVTLDGTTLSESTENLSTIDNGWFGIGILGTVATIGQPPATVLYDNVRARIE